MKSIRRIMCCLLLGFCLIFISSCNKKLHLIPEQNISYETMYFGNVIQDSKQGVFFKFRSDYTVEEIELKGMLYDRNNKAIYDFETKFKIDPTKQPEVVITVPADLIDSIAKMKYDTLKAYTSEKILDNIKSVK